MRFSESRDLIPLGAESLVRARAPDPAAASFARKPQTLTMAETPLNTGEGKMEGRERNYRIALRKESGGRGGGTLKVDYVYRNCASIKAGN